MYQEFLRSELLTCMAVTHTHTPCGYVDEVRDVRIVDCCLCEQLLQVRVARVLSQLLDYSVWACGGRGVYKNMKSCTHIVYSY